MHLRFCDLILYLFSFICYFVERFLFIMILFFDKEERNRLRVCVCLRTIDVTGEAHG